MKVVFIYPPNPDLKDSHFKTMGRIPHMGILSIAGMLQKYGFECEFVDAFNFQLSIEETVSRVISSTPDFVAVTSNSSNIFYAKKVIEKLRERIEVPIIIGGQHASNMPLQVMKNIAVDYAIIGEGDFAMLQLLQALQAGEDISGIAGIVYRNIREEVIINDALVVKDLSELPSRAWNLINLRDYCPSDGSHIYKPAISTMMQRGCPLACIYCGVNSIFKHKVRQHSLEFLEQELQYFKENGIVDIQFWDSVFTFNQEWAIEASKIIKKYGFAWNCIGRLDHVNEDLLRLMKDCGCYEIGYGVESGTQKSLDLMKKKQNLEDVKKIVALTKKIGIKVKCFFLVGFSWETREDIQKTFDLAFEMMPHFVAFSICAPYPGAPMWNQFSEKYESVDSFRGIDNTTGNHSVCSNISVEELGVLAEKMRRKYYFSLRYILMMLFNIKKRQHFF